MRVFTPKSNWLGVAVIAICALGGTLASSALILSYQQAQIADDAPYVLEGGQAFASYALVNFFTLAALAFSILLIVVYLLILPFNTERAFSQHLVLAGACLLPCVYIVGLFALQMIAS